MRIIFVNLTFRREFDIKEEIKFELSIKNQYLAQFTY